MSEPTPSAEKDPTDKCPGVGCSCYGNVELHNLPSAEKDALADVDGGLRGTVADAVDFARECSEEWGVPVVVRVEDRRADLPPIIARRADHDGPTWIIRPRPIPPAKDAR